MRCVPRSRGVPASFYSLILFNSDVFDIPGYAPILLSIYITKKSKNNPSLIYRHPLFLVVKKCCQNWSHLVSAGCIVQRSQPLMPARIMLSHELLSFCLGTARPKTHGHLHDTHETPCAVAFRYSFIHIPIYIYISISRSISIPIHLIPSSIDLSIHLFIHYANKHHKYTQQTRTLWWFSNLRLQLKTHGRSYGGLSKQDILWHFQWEYDKIKH